MSDPPSPKDFDDFFKGVIETWLELTEDVFDKPKDS